MAFLGNAVAGAVGYLRINADDVDRGVNQASGALDRLTTISRNSYFGLRNIGVAFEAVGDAAVAGIGLATNAAVNWEQSLAEVDRTNAEVTNGVVTNTEALSNLHDQLTAIVSISPTSPGVIGNIAAEAGALGVAEPNVARFTDTVSKLLVTTDLTQEAATTGLARIAALTGATADQYDNLASAIVETGRSTQATETEIVDIGTRFAGVGASFKLTKAEIIGTSAALASVGLPGRIGVTALQRVFQQMSEAVTNGGTDLTNFAATSGVTVDRFKQLFQEDAYGALQVFVSGLGDALNRGQDLTPILDNVNITQSQSVRTLRQLALAQSQAGNDAQSLSGSVNTANASFAAGNALQSQASRIYGTTSNQLKILHNDITVAAISFGALFLPALRFAASVLQNFALGLSAIPGPIRAGLAILTALAAVVGVVGGAMLLLLPRFLIARDALIQLAIATREEEGAAASSVGPREAQAGSLAALVDLTSELVAIQLVLIGEYETLAAATLHMDEVTAEYVAISATATVANGAEAASIGVLEAAWISLQAVMGPVGLGLLAITVVITGVIALIGHLGKAHKDAAQAAMAQASADQSLADAMEKTASGVKNATNEWIINKLAMDGTLKALNQMGISAADLIALVQGTLPQNKIKNITDNLYRNAAAGDDASKKAIKSLIDITTTYSATVGSEKALSDARKQGVIDANNSADANYAVGESNDSAAQKAEKAASAAASYATDLLQEKQAALQVQESQAALAAAADDLANKDLRLAEAEEKYASSQTNELVAADKLIQARLNLDRARADQQDDLDSAIRKEQSDELALQRAILNVAKSQNDLNKQMDPEESADKLTDAYNALREAQLGLVGAQQQVSDAQWYVNYLMGEGASQRDIQDAQFALANAQQKVADQTDKVSDSQRALDQLANGGETARQQADAELALREAELAVVNAQKQLADQQQAVIDKRNEVANDTAYHAALEAEQQAEQNVTQSHLDTTTALRNLHDIQNGSIERAFADAQLNVEGAIIQQAQAIVNTQRDWDAMHGNFWTSIDYARRLSGELSTLAGNAVGPVRTDLLAMAAAVGNVQTKFSDTTGKVDALNQSFANVGPNAANAVTALTNANSALNTSASWWEKLGHRIGDVWNFLAGKDDSILSKIGPYLFPEAALSKGWDWLTGHAEGGLFVQPHIASIAEDGPELILPLNNKPRTMELLRSAGVLDMLASVQAPTALPVVGSSGGTTVQHIDQSKTVHQGDFKAQVYGYTDLDSALRDWSWDQHLSSRSA